MKGQRQKVALVFGTIPTIEEIDQFQLLNQQVELSVVTSESICGYLTKTSRFQNLRCLALPDHDENPTFLPGLERALQGFDVVIVKERTGLYAFQAVKAKMRNRFRLVTWVDNLTPYPAEDLEQMRTIRQEVNNATDVFFVQSQAAKSTLLIEGINEDRISVVTPWVENVVTRNKKTRASALEKLGLPESAIVIAHIGQIEWEEGLLDLVNGLKLARMQDEEIARRVRLVFCGIGEFGPDLRNALIEMGMDDLVTYVTPDRSGLLIVEQAADFIYNSSTPSRDRIEGDPFRTVAPMTYGIPMIASRSPIVDEICGKHRIDFCAHAPESLASALQKAVCAAALRNNIVKKNLATVDQTFSREKAKASFDNFLQAAVGEGVTKEIGQMSVDDQVLKIESFVSGHKYLDAIELIEKVFESQNLPVHHESNLYRLIGDCFAKLGDNDSARDAYNKAISIDEFSAKSYIGLGTIALVKETNDVAVFNFQKAIGLAPNDEMSNLGLGLAFQGLGEFKEAMKWVKKSLEIAPENQSALFTAVKLGYELNEYDDAVAVLENYLNAHPSDHNFAYTLAGIYSQVGNKDRATELLGKILAEDATNERAQSLLAEVEGGIAKSGSTSLGE